MAITNVEYLIQKYSESREMFQQSKDKSASQYWRGSMDTYHNLLVLGFNDWCLPGSTGHEVFTNGLTYDQAINKLAKDVNNF
jgi:hypothetical protein